MGDFFVTSLSKFGSVLTALFLFFIVLGTIFFIAGKFQGKRSRYLAAVIFIAPAVILLLVGLVIPAIQTIIFSFKGPDSLKFVGLDNYMWMAQDPAFATIMRNTLLWLLVSPLLIISLGLFLAISLNRMKYEAIAKSILFMPMAISFVGASIIWKFIYDFRNSGNQTGLLNAIWTFFGGEPVIWLLSKPLNTFLLMVVLIWTQVGFATVIFSAAIKALPQEVIEASEIDGAYGLKLFRFITFPMVKVTVIVVLAIQVVGTLKIFDIVETMTGGNFGTNVLANEMYAKTFVQYDQGKGSALAVVLFICVLPVAIFNIKALIKARKD